MYKKKSSLLRQNNFQVRVPWTTLHGGRGRKSHPTQSSRATRKNRKGEHPLFRAIFARSPDLVGCWRTYRWGVFVGVTSRPSCRSETWLHALRMNWRYCWQTLRCSCCSRKWWAINNRN